MVHFLSGKALGETARRFSRAPGPRPGAFAERPMPLPPAPGPPTARARAADPRRELTPRNPRWGTRRYPVVCSHFAQDGSLQTAAALDGSSGITLTSRSVPDKTPVIGVCFLQGCREMVSSWPKIDTKGPRRW